VDGKDAVDCLKHCIVTNVTETRPLTVVMLCLLLVFHVIYDVVDLVLCPVCQVHHHVLAEQRETLLDHIIASISSNRQTLENAVSTKDLDKLWSRINGVCSHA